MDTPIVFSDIRLRGRAAVSKKGTHCRAIVFFGAAFAVALGLLPCALHGTFSRLPLSPPTLAAAELAGAVILALITCLLLCAVRLGREAWFASCAAGKLPGRAVIFFWLSPKRALRALRLFAALTALRAVWGAVFFSPGLLVLGAGIYAAADGRMAANIVLSFLAAGALMLACGLIFFFVTVQKYMLCARLLVLSPEIKIGEALARSEAAMDGRCLRAAAFKLGFIPWFALCVFVLPALFVLPYYKQACAIFSAQALNSMIGSDYSATVVSSSTGQENSL